MASISLVLAKLEKKVGLTLYYVFHFAFYFLKFQVVLIYYVAATYETTYSSRC